ncbi:MAG TPA: carboxypeptidase-like regulatory domain-containing protein, partial [Terriglobales bacterium]|nr:carboxypeptidase-like regulatory domain-containing protein [Terriglobales bacterium]
MALGSLLSPTAALPQTVTKAPERRLPHHRVITTSSLEGLVTNEEGRGVVGCRAVLRGTDGKLRETATNADGIFRISDLDAGVYRLDLLSERYETFTRDNIQLGSSEVLTIEVKLRATDTSGQPGPLNRPLAGAVPPSGAAEEQPPYRELRRRPAESPGQSPEPQSSSENENFERKTYRWEITGDDPNDPLNSYRRYSQPGEYVYTSGHWWDPFNRNRLKGDYPIFGQQTFFSFTGSAVMALDGRRLPTPSLVASRNPGEFSFFGAGGQFFLSELFRFTGELYHGDTSFRPKDWRIVFTPAFNLNYLATQERGIVNINPQRGTNRFDDHVGLQQAFVEYKIKDLSLNYDFLSVRAGIQQFQSDFRGFIYSEEQPGLRIFGNLRSDRYEYNLAYFHHLEKDTNSG